MLKVWGAAVVAMAVLAICAQARAETRDFIVGGAGYFDFVQRRNDSSTFQLEYKPGLQLGGTLVPFAGGSGPGGTGAGAAAMTSSPTSASANTTTYRFAGLGLELNLGESFSFTPSIAAGYYGPGLGESRDYSRILEFRSGVEAAYQFSNDFRAGLAFYHFSNSGTTERSPTSEVLTFTFSIPFGGPAKSGK